MGPSLGTGFLREVSMNKVDPPIAVQANPITTPGGVSEYNRSEVKTGFPTNFSIFSSVTVTASTFSLTRA